MVIAESFRRVLSFFAGTDYDAANSRQQKRPVAMRVLADSTVEPHLPAERESAPESGNLPYDLSEIIEFNKDLPDSTMTLYIPSKFDRSLLPVKAERLRAWYEEDRKTRNHAKFCLPLTMASGVGYYILSPATFTVEWDGDETHDAVVEIIDGASHAVVDNHSANGSFTIQSGFHIRTKNPGDFVYVKGVANDYRRPFQLLEAMIEAWWTPAAFGLVCILNQPGKFTVQKGEPIAQFFCVNVAQANYGVAYRDGHSPRYDEWEKKRNLPTYNGKGLDYLKGLWPDGKSVCPHFKSWNVSEAVEGLAETELSLLERNLLSSVRRLIAQEKQQEASRILLRVIKLAEQEQRFTTDITQSVRELGMHYKNKAEYQQALPFLRAAVQFGRKLPNLDLYELAFACTDLAFAERMVGDNVMAERHFREGLEIRKVTNADPLLIASSKVHLGSLLDVLKRYPEAEAMQKEALETRRSLLGENHPDTLFSRNGLACLLSHMGRYEEAFATFQSVIAEREKLPNKYNLAHSHNDLAFLYRAQKDWARAEEHYKISYELFKEHNPDGPDVAKLIENLGYLLKDSGQPERALAYFEQLLPLREAKPSAKTDLERCLNMLVNVHQQLGNSDQASKYRKRLKSLKA